MSEVNVGYRRVTPDDMKYVVDSWVRTYRDSDWAGVIPNNVWYSVMSPAVCGLIARDTEVLVAYSEDDPDYILGWLAFELKPGASELVIHYLYVRADWRRGGLGSSLLTRVMGPAMDAGARVVTTHRTRDWMRFTEALNIRIRFIPAIARRKDLDEGNSSKTKPA